MGDLARMHRRVVEANMIASAKQIHHRDHRTHCGFIDFLCDLSVLRGSLGIDRKSL